MENLQLWRADALSFSGHDESLAKKTPIILDVEASGFGRGSYPIEIGVVLSDGSVYQWLIKPLDHWTHWRSEAESIHGLSRDLLFSEGRPVAVVAAELNQILAGTKVFSDGWGVDSSWLALLFHEAGLLQRFRLDSIYSLLNEPQIEYWSQYQAVITQEKGVALHRAATDAKITQETFLRIKEANLSAP